MDNGQAQRSLIYLIHIQKTAGTSIRFYFEKSFGADKCLWHAPNQVAENRDNLIRVAASDPGRFDRYRVVGGHIGFGKIPKPIRDRSPIFVSALRNPVARVVSHYQHILSAPNHGLREQIAGKTLFQALSARGFAAMSDRVQIDYLCGHPDLVSLHKALHEHRYVIGKQERIEDLFEVLSAKFDLPSFDDLRVNIGKPGYEVEIEAQPDYDDAVNLIRRMNKDEFEFYKSFDPVWSNI